MRADRTAGGVMRGPFSLNVTLTLCGSSRDQVLKRAILCRGVLFGLVSASLFLTRGGYGGSSFSAQLGIFSRVTCVYLGDNEDRFHDVRVCHLCAAVLRHLRIRSTFSSVRGFGRSGVFSLVRISNDSSYRFVGPLVRGVLMTRCLVSGVGAVSRTMSLFFCDGG